MEDKSFSIGAVLLLKYSEERYLKQLLDGNLYFNTYKAIAKMEDSVGRGDHYEMVYEQIKSDKIVVPVSGNSITCKAIRHPDGQYTLRYINDDFNANMFCLYAVATDSEFNQLQHELSEEMKLGTDMVCIRNVGEFMRRVEKRLKELKLDYKISPIRYIDMENLNGKKSYFEKPLRFSYQNEIRIAFKSDSDEPRTIDIGDIRDIASMAPVGVKRIRVYKNRDELIDKIEKRKNDLITKYGMQLIQKQILIDTNCKDDKMFHKADREIAKAEDELESYLNGIQYLDNG